MGIFGGSRKNGFVAREMMLFDAKRVGSKWAKVRGVMGQIIRRTR
jgi:hypothetical protein